MARKTSTSEIGDRSQRRHAPLQMALFKELGVKARAGRPAWPDLPEDVRNLLVGLLTQLMLKHVRMTVATEVGDER